MKIITKDCDSVAIRVKQHEIEAYIKDSGICARVEDYIDLAFIDCGRNLEKITCPLCGSNVDFDWFGEALDGCLNGDLIDLTVKMPCCGKKTFLDMLEYDQPCSFGELAVIVEDCGSPDQVIQDLEKIINEKLRVIYARY